MNCSFAKTFLMIGISLTMLASVAAGQTPLSAGSLDDSFGREGKVAFRPQFSSKLSSVAIQADGKIVTAGASGPQTNIYDFVVARFNSNGIADESFGSHGLVTTRFKVDAHSASVIRIQVDGRIVVCVEQSVISFFGVPAADFVVLRFNADGSPDTSFGKNGEVTTDVSGAKDFSRYLLLQSDGKIIVGGDAPINNSIFALARYNPDGTLDQTFNSTGLVITNHFKGYELLNAIALQSDGKIVAAGSTGNDKDTDVLLIRYNSDGSIDQTFGTEGRVISDFGGFDNPRTLLIQANGKIVVVGSQRLDYFGSNGSDIFLVRYNEDGTLDQSFGSNGKIIADSGKFEEAYSAALQGDGKLLIAGTSGPGHPILTYSLSDFLAVRYNADGTLDKDFGNGGKALTDFGRVEIAKAVALDAKGNIVLAGYSGEYSWDGFDQSDFALARLVGAMPKPLPDFSLSTESTTISASRGSKVKLSININRLNGFDSNVTVTAPDTSNLKIVIPEPTVTADGASASFTLKIKKGTPVGNHQLVFTGKDDAGHQRSTTITLAIQ